MAQLTVFEFEQSAAMAEENLPDVPAPVLLFRPPPGKLHQLTRNLAETGTTLSEWVQGWRLAPADRTFGEKLVEALTWAVLGVCLIVWAVVGAFFWLPELVWSTARFSAHLLQAMLEGERPTVAARALRRAVSFYGRGFSLAVEAVRRTDPRTFWGFRSREALPIRRLLRELAWALAVWYVILVVAGAPVPSPGDAWHWVVDAGPLGSLVGGLEQGVGGTVRLAATGVLPGVASTPR